MIAPLIYTTQGNIAPEHLEAHRNWYMRKHAPALLGVGFFSARMFDGEGTRWCNLYEIPGAAIFSTADYKQIASADPFRKTNISRFSNLDVTIYSQQEILDDRGGHPDRVPTMAAQVLTFLRFDWRGADEAIHGWLRDALRPICRDAGGARTVRLLYREEGHPELKTTHPRWCVAIEWTPVALPAKAVISALTVSLPSDAAAISSETFKKRFGLLREDAFG